MAGKVDMVISEDKMAIKGGLNGLRIDACPYNPSERKGKTTKVIFRVLIIITTIIMGSRNIRHVN